MERLFSFFFVLAVMHSGPAPADEYFGPFKESILGIRNHLVDLERMSDTTLRKQHIRGIDNEEIACEAWERAYPNDPWLPGFLSRIIRLYSRGHAGNSMRAKRAAGYYNVVKKGLRR